MIDSLVVISVSIAIAPIIITFLFDLVTCIVVTAHREIVIIVLLFALRVLVMLISRLTFTITLCFTKSCSLLLYVFLRSISLLDTALCNITGIGLSLDEELFLCVVLSRWFFNIAINWIFIIIKVHFLLFTGFRRPLLCKLSD